MLATGDQWLLSCIDVHRRQKSSIKNSFRGIIIITIASIILHSQLFYCYEANLIGTPLQCFTRNVGCHLINDLTFSIIAILCPLFLVAILDWLTILNIRRSRGRIGTMTCYYCYEQYNTGKYSTKTTEKKTINVYL
jgi:hypothetical protein